MIEIEVVGGCNAEGPCQQGSLQGKGMHLVTEVNVRDKSKFNDTAVSPELIDEKTQMPLMESIMFRFPTMDSRCPFCDAQTRVNGVTNMNGIAVETETAQEIAEERSEESQETMKEEAPWDAPDTRQSPSAADLIGDYDEGSGGMSGDEIIVDEPPASTEETFEDDTPLSDENEIDLDEPII